jgi:hypothetical protein
MLSIDDPMALKGCAAMPHGSPLFLYIPNNKGRNVSVVGSSVGWFVRRPHIANLVVSSVGRVVNFRPVSLVRRLSPVLCSFVQGVG